MSYFESQQKVQYHQPHWNKSEINDKITRATPTSQFLNLSPFEDNFRQYDRPFKSDLIKENWNFAMPRDWSKITHQEATNVGCRSHGRIGQQQLQSSDEILLNILEEQQQHISIQKNQILLLEEQYAEQQTQISALKRRIQQLQNDADDTDHSQQNGQGPNEMTTADDADDVQTSFDERSAAHLANEKIFSNIGKLPESFYKGNATMRNSSAIFNYRINELLCSNQQPDINITAAQA